MKMRVGTVQRYMGTIKVAGLRFDFGTVAVSDAEAKNNGISQYAKKLNMGIPQLRAYIKNNSGKVEVELDPNQEMRKTARACDEQPKEESTEP